MLRFPQAARGARAIAMPCIQSETVVKLIVVCAIVLGLCAVAMADEPSQTRLNDVPRKRAVQIPVQLDALPFVPGAYRVGGDDPVAPHGGNCPTTAKTYVDPTLFSGGTYIVEAGMGEGEMAAASYAVPASAFPLKVDMAEAILATSNASVLTTTEWSVSFYSGLPTTGTLVATFASDDVVLNHARVGPGTAGVNIQFSVDPEDPEQIIIPLPTDGSNMVTLAYGIVHHNNQTANPCSVGPPPSSNAFYTVDANGLQNGTNNWLFGLNCGAFGCPPNGGWVRFSNLNVLCRPTGDWVLRLTYESVNCTPAPVINTLVPDHALNTNAAVHVQIQGFNLTGTTAARLVWEGVQSPILGTNIQSTATTVDADFDLAHAPPNSLPAAPGLWTMVVVTLGNEGRTCTNPPPVGGCTYGFTINNPAPPTITDFQPHTATTDYIIHATISGTNFIAPLTVKLQQLTPTVTTIDPVPGTVQILATDTLQCDFDLRCKSSGQSTNTGTYTCIVSTDTPPQATKNFPTLNAQLPPTVDNGVPDPNPVVTNCAGLQAMYIFGDNFLINDVDDPIDPTANSRPFLTRAGQADIPGTNISVLSSSAIYAEFNTEGVATGDWKLKVVNPDCQTATSNPYVLSISGCQPSISSITPNSANNHPTPNYNSQQHIVSITNLAGTNFVSGASVKLTKSGQPDIVAQSVVVVPGSGNQQITCTFDTYLKNTGLWNVVVTNPGGLSATLPNNPPTGGFNITTGPLPSVLSVSPSNPTNCSTMSATINGLNFIYLDSPSAKLTRAGQADIPGTHVPPPPNDNTNALHFSFNLSLNGGAAPGLWNCVVTNPDGQSSTNGTNKVNVVACSVSCTKADMDNNGLRNGADISAFTRVVTTGTGTPQELCAADMGAPSGVSTTDIPLFVDCILNGNCPP